LPEPAREELDATWRIWLVVVVRTCAAVPYLRIDGACALMPIRGAVRSQKRQARLTIGQAVAMGAGLGCLA
jgi:hypothetical protein